jgi:hypothetical protein
MTRRNAREMKHVEKATGLVVLLDALGTKRKGQRIGWDNLLRKWGKVVGQAMEKEGSSFTMHIDPDPGESEGSAIKAVSVDTHTSAFSDTILVAYAAGRADFNLLRASTRFLRRLFIGGMSRGVPLRGAVALGDFYILDGLYLGPAIVEAAKWFDQVDWAGIVMSPRTGKVWRDGRALWSSPNDRAILWNYVEVPFKHNLVAEYKRLPRKMMALSWPSDHEGMQLTRKALRRYAARSFDRPKAGSVEERKKNETLEFFDKICKLADLLPSVIGSNAMLG